jgi:hypothetical protein
LRRKWLAVLLYSCLAGFSAIATESRSNYDGRWWLSVPKEQRRQFSEGYMNCYAELPKRDIQFDESSYTYEARLTDYLKGHSESLSEPVEGLLWKMARPPYAQPVKNVPAAEKWNEKWGYADGDYWRQSRDEGRLGFIQGFLECYSNHSTAAQGTFSKSREWYVGAVSRWYGVKSNDPGEINPRRKTIKIPAVLFRFRDQHSH